MKHQEFDIVRQLEGLWQFKWTLFLLALVAGATALGFTSRRPLVYEATATVMVESQQPKLALPAGLEITYLQDIGSQIEVMRSRSVLERAISQLEPEKAASPESPQLNINRLQEALKTQQVKGTSLVALTVASSDPIMAQKQANAVAEAYVSEAKRIRLTTIANALESTGKQLKQLRAGKIDLSISPSMARLIAQINTVSANTEATSERIRRIESQDKIASQKEPLATSENASVLLNRPELSMISQSVKNANSAAIELSAAIRELKFEPIGINYAEGQTRALAASIGVPLAHVQAMRLIETDPQIRSELVNLEQLLQVAGTNLEEILQQTEEMLQQVDVPPEAKSNERLFIHSFQTLSYRAVVHANLVATSLQAASEQLRNLTPVLTTLTQSQLRRMEKGTTSAGATLLVISRQLKPTPPEQDILLTLDELSAMETRTREVAATLAFVSSELEGMRLDEFDNQVRTELLDVKELLRLANDGAVGLPDEVAHLTDNGEGSLSFSTLSSLQQQLQLSLLTSENSGIRVVDAAAVSPPKTGIFGRYQNVILAIVAALLLGVLGILVFQYLDPIIRAASQVTSYIGLPLLASVSIRTAGQNHQPHSVLSKDDPQLLETFRMLRTNLKLDSCQGQVILVTSPKEREGKTTVAANLARAVALQGRRVLLIDGNLRKPYVATAFGLAEREGLAEFLTSGNESCEHVTQADGVDIILSGVAQKSTEMLSSPRMVALLEKTRHTYDVVIVDSAPIAGCADTSILAKQVDAALLVLRLGISRLDLAKDGRQTLETTGARVAGFVLNDIRQEGHNYLRMFFPL